MNSEELELRDYIEVLLRRKWIIILSFLVTTFSAGIGAFFLVKPTYEATVLLMVSKPGYQVELEPKIKTPIPLEISLETYRGLIKSSDLEEKVIKELGLNQSPYNLTIGDLDEMVLVEAVPRTNLIKIKVKNDSPALAKKIVNTWASLFIAKNKELNLRETREAQSFIENQLEICQQTLFRTEDNLCKFNEKSRIDFLKKEIKEKLAKTISYELRLADLSASIEAEKASIRQARKQLAGQPKTFVLTKSIYDDASFSKLASEVSGKEFLLLENLSFNSEQLNPLYTDLGKRIACSMINRDRYQSEAAQLQKNINTYRTRIELLKKELAGQELTKSRLERIRNTANSVYDVVSQKSAEIRIAVTTKTGTVKIVSLAHEPGQPVGPGKKRIILIGGILGLFLGIFVAFFTDYWQRTGKKESR